ncbi:MAG: hypothetical protein ACI4PV_07075 [Butyricicoccus sp.]
MDPVHQTHQIADTVYEICRIYADSGTLAERIRQEVQLQAQELTTFDHAANQ